jgi:signal peptidase II
MELKKQSDGARPDSGRAFLCRRTKGIMPDWKGHFIFWSVAIFGFILDLWTKKTMFEWLQHQGSGGFTIIDGFLTLMTAVNEGAAFGIASGQRYLLITISVVATLIILVVFLFSGASSRLIQAAFGLFAAGVTGNLYDRIFNDGQVRDFIDVVYWPGKHWPAFNVADSMLCIGAAIIVISELFIAKPAQKHAQLHR